MHGRQSERQWHMWPVPGIGTAADSSGIKFLSKCKRYCTLGRDGNLEDCVHSKTDGTKLSKTLHLLRNHSTAFPFDGRKISIGDCALFQAGNAPPFIGIIRCLTVGKEGNIKLGVNWLYRPADVKLAKGVLLEAAPNEVFYSFHKDEISAASLLHPCKVAFLRKGGELPSGVSSFICRRVYDTTNKCLWWLTDQDYTNERQEEVDQLLDKTRHEMHAAVQSGGPSPKDLNGPASTQHLKNSTDNIQNSSFSQVKGKKRERADQNTDPIKRERSSKSDDGDSGHIKQEYTMRPEEIARITDKDGSLINSEGVGQLVHLMQMDKNCETRKGMDLVLWRTMLVRVIATTDRDDCLSQFVQLRGLPILDDWLQEAHKGKTGDTGSPKEGDKLVEELLLMLLRALDRLPVDLDALQTCNVGKSVNHLRSSHKNMEIQKKARNLVDTWKKRVDAEMKKNDTKSGSSQGVSLPCKQAMGEVVHAHGGRRGGSAEAVLKSSASLTSGGKAVSNRSGQGDTLAKSTSSPSGSVKVSTLLSSTISSKDSHCKLTVSSGTNDIPVTSIKEERSSSSSQSQNNSQSWSSEPGKVSGSARKEDARSSTAGSMSAKGSSSGSRHRKSSNGILGSGISGCQKEAGGGKLIVWSKNTTCEKASHSGPTANKGTDYARGDNTNSQRLIVRFPNPGRSPAPSVSGGSFEDTAIPASRGSSPALSEKHDASDVKAKVKIDISRANAAQEVNTESWQSNEIRDGFAGGDDGDRSSSAIPSEERSRNGEEVGKSSETCKLAWSISAGLGKEKFPSKVLAEAETEKAVEPVVSRTGLIKSCSQISEATGVATDDGGMSLLANAAASESYKVEQVPDVIYSERTAIVAGEGNMDEPKSKCSIDIISSHPPNEDAEEKSTMETKEGKELTVSRDHLDDSANDQSAQALKIGITGQQKDMSDLSMNLDCTSITDVADSKCPLDGVGMNSSEHKLVGEKKKEGLPSNLEVEQCTELSSESVKKLVEGAKDRISNGHTEPLCAEPSKEKTEDGLSAAKIITGDDERQSQQHGKIGTVEGHGKQSGEVHLDSVQDNIIDERNTAVEQSAGPRISERVETKVMESIPGSSDGTLEAACSVAKEIEKEVVGDGKILCSTSSDKDAQDAGTVHHVTSDQVRGSDIIDVKPPPRNSGDVEGRQKDVDVDNQHCPGSRNIVYSDDSQETVTEKGEDMEAEKTTGAGEGEEVDQTNHATVNLDRKITDIQAGPDSVLDNFGSEKGGCTEGGELSRRPAYHVGRATTQTSGFTQEEKQIIMPTVDSMQTGEADAAEKIATEPVTPTKGVIESSDTIVKLDFDLNEGLAIDEAIQDDAAVLGTVCSSVMPVSSSSVTITATSSGLAMPIAVAVAAKGPFEPPANPLRGKGELGWKGSAATSAFRPAEPRRTPERQHITFEGLSLDAATGLTGGVIGNQSRPPLDIDLNVPDGGVLEDVGLATHLSSQNSVRAISLELSTASGHDIVSSTRDLTTPAGTVYSAGRRDLDLNRVEESEETGPVITNAGKNEVLGSSLKTLTNGFSRGESNVLRDFDLNDGPSLEDAGVEPAPRNLNVKSNGNSYFSSVAGLRMNGELVNMSSWFPPGSSHSALAIPSLTSDRTDQPYSLVAAGGAQRILSSAPSSTFNGDSYRGPVLASSPAVAYSNMTAAAFPYGGFSFGSSFPLTSTPFSGGPTSYVDSSGSTCFPAAPSQIVSAGAVSASCVRSYVTSLTEVAGTESNRKWPRPNLDLNAGPGAVDLEAREDRVVSRQLSAANCHLSLEEQTRAFHQTAGSGVVPLKRKEPEGGWDSHTIGYMQPSWQ
eukprot:Gb_05690 [translate_table: standard]